MAIEIVAELSCNHNGSLGNAIKTIESMVLHGADTVKVQTYRPDDMIFNDDKFQWKGRKLWDIYNEAQTPISWVPILYEKASELGMRFVVSVFNKDDVSYLADHGIKSFKIASMEIGDVELINEISLFADDVIISTGAIEYVDELLKAIEIVGDNVTVLYCVSEYPARPDQISLSAITKYKLFVDSVGISDHSKSKIIPAVAVGYGINMIEKHYSMTAETLDGKWSMLPGEFKEMVDNVREAEEAYNCIRDGMNVILKRTLFSTRDIEPGDIITAESVKAIRQHGGLMPIYKDNLIGTKARIKIKAHSPFNFDMVE